jgi:2-polyprenyl-3-methyl-5-hydroxy-6-metoxy-1,4-benzoquinol methylase
MQTELLINSCACCNSQQLHSVFKVIDYTVSHQYFEVWECECCGYRFTQNAPNQTQIGAYYKSENYISHTDTNKGFISKLYHAVRNITLKSKRNLINSISQKGCLLDVGAGTGAFAHTMQQNGWQVTGLEPDKEAAQIALSKLGMPLLPIEKFFSLSPNQFNCITLWHVLEHVHKLDDYFIQFKKILTQNGKLVIAVPNYTSADASHYKQYWAAYDVPRHLHHFSPNSLKTLAQKHDFEVINIKPMWFDSVYVSMLSEQYKTGKQHFIKALWIGLNSNCKALFNTSKCSSVIYILQIKK